MAKILCKSLQSIPSMVIALLAVYAGATVAAEAPASVEPADKKDITLSEPVNRNLLVQMPVRQSPNDLEQIDQFSPEDNPTGNVSDLEQINQPNAEDSVMEQVTSVSQLSDVQPTDWAFQALQNLVERYGCIAGYPDGTFRGNRAITRYEFAAGLNACLEAITQLIQPGGDFVSKEDLALLNRLLEEFQAELATLRGRVDALEARADELEANQFSTTTKLDGEIVFAAVDAIGQGSSSVPHFGHRTRFNLETSFTGEDLLRTRLQTGNLDALSLNSTPAPEGDLFFATDAYGESDGNLFNVDALLYTFPLGERLEVTIAANAGAADDFASTVNQYLDGDGAFGALSRFATRHPIYYMIGGAGVGARYEFSDNLELNLGYMAADGFDPDPGFGFFNGAYGAMAQLLIKPSERLNIGLTYLNSYNNEMGAGSNRANLRTVLGNEADLDLPIISNAFGVEASWQLSKRFVVGGWVGYVNKTVLSTLGGQIDRGDMEIWNANINFAFPDLGKEGNLAAIIVGVEPMVRNSSVSAAVPGLPDVFGTDKDTSLHIEALYQYQVTDNILITPGVVWLTAPDHNNDNEDIVIGTIRTTFTF